MEFLIAEEMEFLIAEEMEFLMQIRTIPFA